MDEYIKREEVLNIVRCKDCEYSKLLRDNENEKHIFRHCRIMNAFVTDNSFCSYGKLRNDVDDMVASKGGE